MRISINRWIKLVFIFVYTLVFLSIAVLKFWSQSVGPSFFTDFLYWMVLFGWVLLIWNFKWKSSTTMIVALILFIFAALFTTLGFRDPGETTMRLSFIGWMVGVVQALVEYRRNEKK